jgi:hypothetical protein
MGEENPGKIESEVLSSNYDVFLREQDVLRTNISVLR